MTNNITKDHDNFLKLSIEFSWNKVSNWVWHNEWPSQLNKSNTTLWVDIPGKSSVFRSKQTVNPNENKMNTFDLKLDISKPK